MNECRYYQTLQEHRSQFYERADVASVSAALTTTTDNRGTVWRNKNEKHYVRCVWVRMSERFIPPCRRRGRLEPVPEGCRCLLLQIHYPTQQGSSKQRKVAKQKIPNIVKEENWPGRWDLENLYCYSTHLNDWPSKMTWCVKVPRCRWSYRRLPSAKVLHTPFVNQLFPREIELGGLA